MNWLQTTLAILQLAPALLQLIAEAEALLGAGQGAAKKTIVMMPLAGAPQQMKDFASGFIDNVVSLKNANASALVLPTVPKA